MYYSKNRKNLPATKYLDLGIDFFWWIEKNKGKSIKDQIEELYQLMLTEQYSLTFNQLRHRKLTLDTKGIIPIEL